MIFVGVDWAEVHHDVCVMDADGVVLARQRIPDSLVGLGELHTMVTECLSDDDDPGEVIVGIEKDRGLIVTALIAADYQVFAINPLAASMLGIGRTGAYQLVMSRQLQSVKIGR